MRVKCNHCDKEFNIFAKNQELLFTFITNTPYIKCLYCNKKIYLNIEKEK